MSDKQQDQTLFEEVQNPDWGWIALALGATAFAGFASARYKPLGRLLVAGLLTGGVNLALTEFIWPLHTQVTPDEVRVRFGKRTRFRIPLKTVTSADPRRYSPIAEYGGWGIRCGEGGGAFNMRGSEGVQLVLRSGRRVLIGSERAHELAATIRKAAGIVSPAEEGV